MSRLAVYCLPRRCAGCSPAEIRAAGGRAARGVEGDRAALRRGRPLVAHLRGRRARSSGRRGARAATAISWSPRRASTRRARSLGEANSFFWPSVDAQAAGSRQQISTRTATSFPGIPREYSNHRATLNVSYELDLFGRLRAERRGGARRARGERGFARSGAPRTRRAGREVLLRAARARRAGRPHPPHRGAARGGARAAAEAPAAAA